VQLIIDGRRSNGGQVAAGYISQVIARWQGEGKGQPELAVRNLYNPNVEFHWHILPALVAIITTTGCLIVTALSVARERKRAPSISCWFPLTAGWIMAGKAVPGIMVAVGQGIIVALAARFVFHLPFAGSLSLLLAGMVCYGLALAGIGLFISSFCSTQQQAFLGVFSFTVPAVILSGYISPVENMPQVFQWLAAIDPLTTSSCCSRGSSPGVRLVGRLAPALAAARHRRRHPVAGARHVPPPYRLTRRLDQLMPVSPSARPAFSDISFHSPAVGKPGFPSTIPHPEPAQKSLTGIPIFV
jgi:ABC-2 type transport system permease protein